MKRTVVRAALLLTLAASVWAVGNPTRKDASPHLRMRVVTDPKALAHGKAVYELSCAPCHGSGGKGDGPLAANVLIAPTDLTRGVFANRSTVCGELPTDYDLYHTVTGGIHNSAMPSFNAIAPEDRIAVVDYIKTLAPRFLDTIWYPLLPIDFGDQVPPDAQSLERGRIMYIKGKCAKCHGPYGQGDGPAVGVLDTRGMAMGKSDLTNPSDYRYSTSVRDLYRIFSSELDAAKFTQQERWDLSNYVWSLRR